MGEVIPENLKPLSLTLIFLAEALLEQAMIGPSPNPLILSYLKYAISSQVNTLASWLLEVKHLEN